MTLGLAKHQRGQRVGLSFVALFCRHREQLLKLSKGPVLCSLGRTYWDPGQPSHLFFFHDGIDSLNTPPLPAVLSNNKMVISFWTIACPMLAQRMHGNIVRLGVSKHCSNQSIQTNTVVTYVKVTSPGLRAFEVPDICESSQALVWTVLIWRTCSLFPRSCLPSL